MLCHGNNAGGKAPIVQPNYGLLSTAAAVHRGAGQRLIAELLQRLGVHILSARSIKVWDGFGKHKVIASHDSCMSILFCTLGRDQKIMNAKRLPFPD